ncbi:LysM peptidoglycan-binding domain-containing protein [Shewanella intestini]|uniref:LysM peptidoglycan-binding domain-containing protein n=1 Tax=Shewanella intestini TaxID=2017544 RepID=A0ABS5I1T1_9GAMM|nr:MULTISPECIES: LysM peptidoglycan-binding domain-containing protein [Shewanella]MBR9727866.1 LysM peptidoglycan-binding domain-containing protein [Shewanella intestini]MRG36141.1 LysM peptidoglycan-binding domain-containing protein [Shewanella sp. XMDDZSB0408]
MKLRSTLVLGSLFAISGCQSLTTSPDTTTTKTNAAVISVKSTSLQADNVEAVQQHVAEVTDVWQRMANGFHLAVPDKKLVNQYRQWYLNNPKHLEIVSQRAAPYMHYIVEEVERRGLPLEIALLPIIESAFDTHAYSGMHASGLWQLTAPTAKTFGVRSDWWYDGRRDVIASTNAALDLLEYLYAKMGHNWLYAVAAYNTGEGRVFNAIKRNKAKGKPVDFWSLSLPRETSRYVPQLLALADVIKHANNNGQHLYPIINQPSIKVVDIGSQLDLNLAADLADVSVNDIKKLNAGLKSWATPPSGPHQLLLPSDKVAGFKRKLEQLDPAERINWLRYQIQPGDSLSVIAKQFNITSSIIRSNNGLKNNNIIAGKHLIIPVASNGEMLNINNVALTAKHTLEHNDVKRKVTYKVRSGDSLWKIARRFDIRVAQLTQWNNLHKDQALSIGRSLVVYPNQDNNSKILQYQVKSGDSLNRIANKYKVTVQNLIKWNGLENKKYIQPGQTLTLRLTNS